jgi:hypothetical protein
MKKIYASLISILFLSQINYAQSLFCDDFENGTNGWTAVSVSGSIWQQDTFSIGSTPNHVWDIGLYNGFLDTTISYLYSPVINITGSTNLTVSFRSKFNTETYQDGTRLESSIDGGLTWQVVGAAGFLNWYNAFFITSSFGLPGWSGTIPVWEVDSWSFGNSISSDSIQFRFVFTSDISVSSGYHMIDDFCVCDSTGSCISPLANAQPWAQPGAHWFYQDGDNVQIGYSGYIEITKTGDTLINGIICDILKCHHAGISWWQGGLPYNYYSSNQYTYVNNDTVYQWRNNQFYILYVLSAQPPDYWITGPGFYGNNCQGDTIRINNSQLVNVNGVNMRKLTPNPYGSIPYPQGGASIFLHDTIYERFGCVSFLFPVEACVTDIPIPRLRCYSDSSGFTYSTNIAPYCNYIWTGINEINSANHIIIHPNPASTEFQITNFNFQTGDEIILRDVLGKIYFTKKISSLTSNFKLQTLNFANGIYFLELKIKEGVLNKKVVVQH